MLRTALYSVLFFLLTTRASYAYSGDMAIAVPVRAIAVDGDLSDWPQTARWYSIEKVAAGVHAGDSADFTGAFSAGYAADENALYLAVEIQDESTVLDADEWPQWDAQDGCQIYVQEKGQPVVQYVAYGPHRQVYTEGAILDMDVRGEVQLAIARTEGVQRYEWRIELARAQQEPGALLGFGLSINDVDRDGSYSWFGWARAITNHMSRGVELKAALLLVGDEPTAHLRGAVRWPDGQAAHRAQIEIRRADDADWKVRVPTDALGKYQVDLPAGRYVIEGEEPLAVELSGVDTLVASVILRYPQGQRVAARWRPGIAMGTGFSRGLWHLFGPADGVPAMINDMMRDREGNLWMVGSEIVRYDGEKLARLERADGLALGSVLSVAEDQEGHIWLGTNGDGLVRYDGRDFTFFMCDDGLGADVVRDVAVDALGQVWVATEGGGLVRYDGMHFVHYTSADGLACDVVQQLEIDAQGQIWAATWGGGLSRYDGSRFTTFTTADGLGHNIVESVYADSRGRIWSGTINEGLSVYEDGEWSELGTGDGLDVNWVRSIYEDGVGAMWFSSTRQGVVRWDGASAWHFDKEDGLAADITTAIAEDAAGRLWFAGVEGGASRYNGAFMLPVASDAEGAQGHAVYGLVEDSLGRVWVGTRGGGARRFADNAIRHYSVEDGLATMQVRAMLADRQGGVWFGFSKWGISRFDGESWRSWGVKEGVPIDDMMCLYEDRQGYIWLGMEKSGVLRYDGTQFRRFTIDNGLVSNGVDSIVEDAEGRLLLATSPVTVYENGRFTPFVTADGQQIEGVQTLYRDRDGRLWFGTDRGALCYDGKELVRYAKDEGLIDEHILAITQDRRGRMWFGTRGGVGVFDGRVFQQLTVGDGLPHSLVLRLLEDRHGDMWFGTLSGAVRYRPRARVPSVVVRQVVANRRYNPGENVSFSTLQDIVAFDVARVGVEPRSSSLYRYRLRGLQEVWQTSAENRIEYRDLSRGEYIFEVEAVDQDLNYSLPLRVSLHVHLPYERYALGAALALALALIVWQGVRLLRNNTALAMANARLQEADQLKSDFVSNVSHELRTPLIVIKSSVDNMLAGITGPLNTEQDYYLDRLRLHAGRLSLLIEDLLDLSRIEAGYLQLRKTKVSMTRIARNVVDHLQVLAQGEQVELICVERGGEHYCTVDPDRIYQILVNLINNAIKFTPKGGQVSVETMSQEGSVQVLVRDTGPGIAEKDLQQIFDKFHQLGFRGRRGAGIGLSIARNLVELHGGRIWAESAEEKGSTFIFVLPEKE